MIERKLINEVDVCFLHYLFKKKVEDEKKNQFVLKILWIIEETMHILAGLSVVAK